MEDGLGFRTGSRDATQSGFWRDGDAVYGRRWLMMNAILIGFITSELVAWNWMGVCICYSGSHSAFGVIR